ncbi:MAG: hypothetical protein WD139_09045 [Balneolaceae bacterium]
MILSFLLVVFISCVHIFANKISFLRTLPRNKWLSLAGGISVAFVFLHILPELHHFQDSIDDTALLPVSFENDLYLMAMAGILLFYGIERGIIRFRSQGTTQRDQAIDTIIYRSHIAVFALFNLIIGYYLHHEMKVDGLSSLLTFMALGFHFLINDYSLLRHHKKLYHRTGRWIMTAAVITGWGIGATYIIPETISSLLFALVAGAIILNSFKEELPEEKESNFGFFLIGATLYSVLWIV